MDTIMFYRSRHMINYRAFSDPHWTECYFDTEAEKIIRQHGYSFKKRVDARGKAPIDYYCNVGRTPSALEKNISDKEKIGCFSVFYCYR